MLIFHNKSCHANHSSANEQVGKHSAEKAWQSLDWGLNYRLQTNTKTISVKNTMNVRFLSTVMSRNRLSDISQNSWFSLVPFASVHLSGRFSSADRKYWIINSLASFILWLKCFIISIKRGLLEGLPLWVEERCGFLSLRHVSTSILFLFNALHLHIKKRCVIGVLSFMSAFNVIYEFWFFSSYRKKFRYIISYIHIHLHMLQIICGKSEQDIILRGCWRLRAKGAVVTWPPFKIVKWCSRPDWRHCTALFTNSSHV